jgi:shikimate kinase
VTTPPIIVLVGLMGTGKTTVARSLADHYKCDCLDTDKLVEQSSGTSVRDLFEQRGEEGFRSLESDVLAQCLRSPRPAVVAGAGGVVLRKENREMLLEAQQSGRAIVVWLHARPDVLVSRTQKGVHRPLLDGDRAETLERLTRERTPLYSEVADIVVDVSERSSDSVTALIIEAITVAGEEGSGSNE